METGTNSKAKLLAVLAHPDDESFGMGGTLALYAQRGASVYLICATRGEVGDMDPEYMQGFDTVAQRREHELRCAAQKLGLAGVYFLDYRDSGMPGTADNHHPRALAAAPQEQVADQIVEYIRRIRPQVVITFDPIGGYRHPDHIAIHEATVRAFALSGDGSLKTDGLEPYQPQKLYFQTISRRFLRIALGLLPLFGKDPHKWGRNGDVDLVSLAKEEFPIHAVIDFAPVQELKKEASLCHESQGGSAMVRGAMGWVLRRTGTKETFMRAYPSPDGNRREHDLFAGVNIAG
jgi:N-acetyl-1-D-myo-inositol-2-amino-2-deoxy-alpha-D-glucopyranoside deacetylase